MVVFIESLHPPPKRDFWRENGSIFISKDGKDVFSTAFKRRFWAPLAEFRSAQSLISSNMRRCFHYKKNMLILSSHRIAEHVGLLKQDSSAISIVIYSLVLLSKQHKFFINLSIYVKSNTSIVLVLNVSNI